MKILKKHPQPALACECHPTHPDLHARTAHGTVYATPPVVYSSCHANSIPAFDPVMIVPSSASAGDLQYIAVDPPIPVS